MKGVIFAEMIHWIEEAFSPAVADAVIVKADVPSKGVYTGVGTYPHQEALAIMGALSDIAEVPGSELCEAYGHWLAKRFFVLYSDMFAGFTDTLTFLRAVDGQHHKEVVKLYPDARTPKVLLQFEGEQLVVSYASHRPFADVAFGLIRGYVDHFGDALDVVRDNDQTSGPYAALFHIRRREPVVAAPAAAD